MCSVKARPFEGSEQRSRSPCSAFSRGNCGCCTENRVSVHKVGDRQSRDRDRQSRDGGQAEP